MQILFKSGNVISCEYVAKHRSTLAVYERVHTGEKCIKCKIFNNKISYGRETV